MLLVTHWGRLVPLTPQVCLAAAAANDGKAPEPAVSVGDKKAGGPALDAVRPAARPLASASELLAAYGIGANEFKKCWDGRPPGDDEIDLVLRILVRLKGCRAVDIERWAHGAIDVDAVAARPATRRGAMFNVSGRVAAFDSVPLPKEAIARSGVRQLFRLLVLSDPEKRRVVVYTDHVPPAWHRGGAIGERVALAGMFLKISASDASDPLPVLVAPRLAWRAATPLGDLGMDVTLLENVTDGKPLLGSDRDAFYEMLAVVARAPSGQLLRIAGEVSEAADQQNPSVAALFNDPAAQRGRLVHLSGVAHRIVRIAIDDPEAVARWGRDHYYEIDLFPADSQGNPVVVCVPDLPEGMAPGEPPKYRDPIEVAGFFLKTWRYPVTSGGENDAKQADAVVAQLAPLVIGQAPVRLAKARAGASVTGMIAGAMLALVMIGVWLLLWHLRQGDQDFFSKEKSR